jgi:hypothetical protein
LCASTAGVRARGTCVAGVRTIARGLKEASASIVARVLASIPSIDLL